MQRVLIFFLGLSLFGGLASADSCITFNVTCSDIGGTCGSIIASILGTLQSTSAQATGNSCLGYCGGYAGETHVIITYLDCNNMVQTSDSYVCCDGLA